ncbi:hypothetical protein SB781_32110, partial [Paraburkholderia sp. SIMBA_061]
TQPSADTLRRFLDSQPSFDEIDLRLFSHGTEGIGVTRIDEWKELLGRASCKGRFLGVDTRRYPSDFAIFLRFDQALRELGPLQNTPPPMTFAQFESALREHGIKHRVSMTIHPHG